jgi:hypothetical protein
MRVPVGSRARRSALTVFGLGSLRDLPDIEALEDAGLLPREPAADHHTNKLDEVLGFERGEW